MNDYFTVDLSKQCNVGANWVEEGSEFPRGEVVLRGLPFHIVSDETQQPHFIGFGAGGYVQPVEIPIKNFARWVIFAHRLMESKIMEGELPGHVICTYRFRYSDSEEVEVPIRERFEISSLGQQWGQLPFMAVPDVQDELFPREEGRWEATGERQVEVEQAWPHWFVLWAWRNSDPEREVESIWVDPGDRAFIIAGITLSNLDEEPFGHEPIQPVILSLNDDLNPENNSHLSLEIDRGVATYVYPVGKSFQDGKGVGFEGWGIPSPERCTRAYAGIAAQPSATISLNQGDREIAEFKWEEVLKEGSKETEQARIEIVNRGKNWVHVQVVEDETGKPVPCRIHFQSPEGIPYQPHGHHDHILSDMGTFHIDLGGDVRLGHLTYACIDGQCQGWLPRGEVWVDIARGFEYEPLRDVIHIHPGQRELTLRLRRWKNMNKARWFSGDSHVHFLSTMGASLEAQCEDLNIVNLLQSQWGHLYTNVEDFIGRPVSSEDGRTIVYTSQENRQHMLGHLILLGLKKPVMPWCSDGAGEAEIGGTMEVTLSHWADACHEQGGTIIIPHFPNPNGEPAALIATGRADAVEMLRHRMYNHIEYYRYLNGGYCLPLVGGTDKMTSNVPVGLYRTYVNIPDDEPFNYENWCKNLRLGRTFLSGGPLLKFTVNGHQVGDVVRLSGNGGTLELEAEAESIFPIHALEIVQQGQVVADTRDPAGVRHLRLKAKLKVDRPTWLAARVGNLDYRDPLHHFDVWSRGVMAHTSPIYVAFGDEWQMFNQETMQYMLTLLHGGIEYIHTRARQYPAGSVTHHHGEEDHMAYLERPFKEAIEAIERRIQSEG
jgi:hypothetical protein